MKFGLGMMIRNPQKFARPAQDVYRDHLELAVLGEKLQFDHLWMSEHHFLDDGWNPSALPLLAAIAPRTQRIRLGTGVILLPFHHPIRLAEDAATVDILSNGRSDLGVGPGSNPVDYQTFKVPMSQRMSRMYEALDIIERCFNQEEFSYKGKYWEFNNVRMTTKPVQKPLPLWIGGFSPKTLAEAGKRGYQLCAAPPTPLQKIYDDALRASGHNPKDFQRAGLHVGHVAETTEKAWDEAEWSIHWHMTVHYKAISAKENTALRKGNLAENEAPSVPPLGELRKSGRGPYGPAFVGSPDHIIKMIEEELKVAPMTEIMWGTGAPGMPISTMRKSLELFAKEVMPHFRDR